MHNQNAFSYTFQSKTRLPTRQHNPCSLTLTLNTHASHLTALRRHTALHLLRLLSIDLDVPLARLLELRELLLPYEAPRGRHALKRLEDARQHRLQPAEVDVRALVEPVEELLRVLGETILDVPVQGKRRRRVVCVRQRAEQRERRG